VTDPRDEADEKLTNALLDLVEQNDIEIGEFIRWLSTYTNDVVACQMYGAAELLLESFKAHLEATS
jgi:hypothetical protein